MKLSDLSLSSPPRVLLYGELGTGKTALALTLGSRAQIHDLDGGLRTGLTLKDSFTSERLAVDVKQFFEPEPQKRAVVFQQYKTFIYGLTSDAAKGSWPYNALILDSISAFAWSAVSNVMANSGRLGQNPEIQHWGLAFTDIKNVIAVIRSLPCVVIVLGHEQSKSIGEGAAKKDKIELAIPGKNMVSEVGRLFDEIWHIRAKPAGGGKFSYILQTKSDGVTVARSRSNLPDGTDTACGMWKLLEMCGYRPPERKEK